MKTKLPPLPSLRTRFFTSQGKLTQCEAAFPSGISATAVFRFARSARLALLSLLCVLFTVCGAQAAIIYSFEEDEGFELGKVHTQNDWTGPDFTTIAVSDLEAKSGLWSLAVRAGGSSASSPDLLDGEHTAISLSTKTSAAPPSSTFYSRFRIVIGNASGSTSTLEFYMRRQSTGYEVSYREFAGASINQKRVIFSPNYSPTAWNDFSIVLSDDKKSYTLSINDNVIAANIALSSSATMDDFITHIQFYNVAESAFSGTVYYDNIVSIPEPSALSSLLLLGGAAFGLHSIQKRAQRSARR